ncbi:outer membrane beta-barrel protein [Bradyrhizobium ontarionense]|uniref:Outer membrane beta-barrel protein n=1 Tax=Bradyrhizobium ontarionense TaxID=2898149 RepID=A0ABY3REK9_9BRAD|nr:outer membrane beta-barrel protein [Bradyrhizobium sp. A19]UFZ05874.1 outer membrane beta-barrel protein [Bradyrhizobium sp. A19]
MTRIFLGAASLMVLGALAPAGAADLAARPYTKAPVAASAPLPTWTGFYLGLQGGGGWGRSDETYFFAPNVVGFTPTQRYDISGGFVGGVVGYNWQVDNIVFGLEGDYHWADINGRSAVISSGAGFGDTYFTKLRGFGDIKGRLGWATGPALLFVSGGASVGDLQHRYDPGIAPPPAGAVQNDWRWGWTIGAGAEYMFAANWSAKVEYNYIDFGESTIQYTNPLVTTNRSEWKDTVHTVKAGISYHFGGPIMSRY